jgi:threonine dehydrogenase-like Zn-dependent dehydrogenase
MKALCWHGTGDVRVDTVADPTIQNPRDIIIKITSTAICGSDLHLFNGFQPTMEKGDQLGHENMGEVVEVGSGVSTLKVGDRVVGYAGGQAEYLRVPFADVAPIKIPDGIPDEKVLFLSDIFPTGYMAAENCAIEPGDTVAVWGCGPVGQFAMQSAWMFGAGRVIAIDRVPERLTMAEHHSKAETINFDDVKVYDRLMEMTNGRGPDRCIDAVGAEAHGSGSFDAVLDKAKAAVMLGTDRPHVLREAIMCCRKAGTISVPGVYIGLLDKIPFGAAMNKGITFRMGQTHVPRYTKPLLEKIQSGVIDPSFVITHRVPLDDAPAAYKTFRDKEDGCIKVVLKP